MDKRVCPGCGAEQSYDEVDTPEKDARYGGTAVGGHRTAEAWLEMGF